MLPEFGGGIAVDLLLMLVLYSVGNVQTVELVSSSEYYRPAKLFGLVVNKSVQVGSQACFVYRNIGILIDNSMLGLSRSAELN